MNNNFTTLKNEIDEKAKEQLNTLYPSFCFREQPTRYVTAYHINGNLSSKGSHTEKSYIYKNSHTIDENGGGSMSLFDFFCLNYGLNGTPFENLQTYANAVGYQLPDGDEMEAIRKQQEEAERKRQQRETDINNFIFTLNAQTKENAVLRDFLGGRKWNDQFIKYWRVGYDPNHQTHPLTIPILKNGKCDQIARRTIYKGVTPKYLNEPNEIDANGKTIKNNNSYLGFAPYSCEYLFICEGIADAMALNFHGINAGCTFSNNINAGQKAEIERRIKNGLKRVFLVVDNDQAGETATIKNGEFLQRAGVSVKIVTFGDLNDVKDADDYFNKAGHTPAEFTERVKNAPTFSMYLFMIHRRNHKETDINAYFEAVAKITNDTATPPADKIAIYQAMEADDANAFSIFKEYETNAKQTKQDTPEPDDTDIKERAKMLFKPYQKGDVWKLVKEYHKEAETGYLLQTMNKPEFAENWTIPANDLTLICGYTSHGKTKVLQNLFLNMAYDPNTNGRFLFVSYEESKGDILREMANIRINKPLSLNQRKQTNIEAMNDYLQNGGSCNGFAESVDKTLNELDAMAYNGRIMVEETSTPVEILAEAIRQQVEAYKDDANPIKAVFVDYVQLLEMENPDKSPNNIQLKIIALTLHNVAKQTQTPIICGAQLSREQKKAKDANPLFINESDIADSAYLERTSAEVVILYDGNRLHEREFAKIKGNQPDDAQKALIEKGFAMTEIGEKTNELNAVGRMYIKICKHRGKRANVDGVLLYTPETGNISNLPDGYYNSTEWQAMRNQYNLQNLQTTDGTQSTAGVQVSPTQSRLNKPKTNNDLPF